MSNSDDIEFSLRPLRISKRSDSSTNKSQLHSASSDTTRPRSDSSIALSTKSSSHSSNVPQASSDEFVCRPMRLGSGAARPISSESHDHSSHQGLTFVTETDSVSSHGSQPSTPRRNSKSSRRSSVHVRSLPIVQSPKRKTETDLSKLDDMIFALCLVDFHHVRGPEVQWWKSNYHADYNLHGKLFKNLSFQALPDGSHLFEETFSNFNLVYDFANAVSLDDQLDFEQFTGNPNHLETLFGCSCVRQVKTTDLSSEELERNKDITRSIVQKAVVVISRKQPIFTKIKEKLSIITHSYFQQTNFTNTELLEKLFDNLNGTFKLIEEEPMLKQQIPEEITLLENKKNEKEDEFFVNLNLRSILSNYKSSILIILKALLLEQRVLVYSNNNLELLTQFQNNLIALIPDLHHHLDLSGCPLSDYTEKHSPLTRPTSLKTNDRRSMVRFFGLPLHVFNTKGSFWNPYLPLQQFDELHSESFMVGCSNLLILNQASQHKINVVVNLDSCQLSYPTGKPEALSLSHYDKRFIQSLLHSSSNEDAFEGSDDYIRYQFEDYIRSLLATTRFYQYMERFKSPPPGFDVNANKHYGNLKAFNDSFVDAWFKTKNFKIWDSLCDDFIFNFHDPLHIAIGSKETTQSAFGNFFANFNKQQQPTLVERANEYFSHSKKPQKFIPKEEQATEVKDESHSSGSTKKFTWGWGASKS
ncbi:hypothetical protein CJI97_001637 [Candidozyma auris]|nr:hypothetical protein CJI97_001637 [[Candida] auris]